MEKLEQFYESVGSHAAEVTGRLGGDPALVLRFLMKFQEDDSLHQLCAALDSGDTESAFRMAHTLKGLCATLGLQRLFERASAMTELLRGGAIEPAKAALPDLQAEYERVHTLIDGLR
jgi:histidine phosphotransfer protein HptB